MTRRAFEDKTILLPVDGILSVRPLGEEVRKKPKFKTILASVREVGVIEPLAVFRDPAEREPGRGYIPLDDHLRLEARKALGIPEAVCLVSTDDEAFTYNRQVNDEARARRRDPRWSASSRPRRPWPARAA